jgi:hypothetical protein
MCKDCPPFNDPPLITSDPLPDCPAGEPCAEVTDASCVVYEGPAIPGVGINPGDRLDKIIEKWGQDKGTQAIATENTADVTFSGNGQNSTPLKADVNLDPDNHNLISKTDKGLISKITLSWIQDFASIVTSDPEAHTLFCALVSGCASGYCGTAVDLSVVYVDTILRVTWVPYTDNSIGQVVEYKKLNDTQWISLSTMGAFQNTVDIPGIMPNTIYQVRVQTNCFIGGPTFNIPFAVSSAFCVQPVLVASYDNIAYSFKYVPYDYTKLTVTLQRVDDGSIVGSKDFDLAAHPSDEIDGIFTGLDDLSNYQITIIMNTPLGPGYTKTCPPIPVSTVVIPSCNIPSGLKAFLNSSGT